jgi:hypothetical protein
MIPDKLRPMVAPVTAFASGLLAAYLAKHGIDVSDETAASIVVGVTAIGSHLIAIKTNPNNAAAPSMVKMAPNAPYAGATDDPFAPGVFVPPPIAPIPIGEQVSPYAPKNPNANAVRARRSSPRNRPPPRRTRARSARARTARITRGVTRSAATGGRPRGSSTTPSASTPRGRGSSRRRSRRTRCRRKSRRCSSRSRPRSPPPRRRAGRRSPRTW